MKKHLLLSTVLGLATVFSIAQGAFAVSANQNISGVLSPAATISIKTGQSVATDIATSNGALTTALTPGFIVYSNDPLGAMTLSASVTGSDGAATGFGTNTAGDTYYVALGNTTNKPTKQAVEYALANVVSQANPNVIAYSISAPIVSPSGEGKLTFAYDSGTFKASGGADAATYTVISTTGLGAKGGTFEPVDTAGSYVANLTLSFD